MRWEHLPSGWRRASLGALGDLWVGENNGICATVPTTWQANFITGGRDTGCSIVDDATTPEAAQRAAEDWLDDALTEARRAFGDGKPTEKP